MVIFCQEIFFYIRQYMSIVSFIITILKHKGYKMKVSYHAGQRFLERVIKKADFTKYEVHRTVEYLERLLADVVLNSYAKPFALPGFENQFQVINRDNVAITIVPKHN